MGNALLRKGLQFTAALWVITGICSLCRGHCDPPPPPRPPLPPLAPKVRWVYPPRWSWLHWWEANRDLYLRTLQQNRAGQKPDQKVTARFRARAVEALLAATKSEHWQVRASAALALGRMAEPSAYESLKALAGSDAVETVRVFALVALGLLDSAEAERSLLARDYPTLAQREAALVGVGLLSKPTPAAVVGLQKLLQDPQVGPATMSAWALKYQTDPANAKFLQGVLNRTPSAWLASEAILALGQTGDPKCVGPLADILLATAAGKSLPAWQELEERHKKLLRLVNTLRAATLHYDSAHDKYVEEYKKWQKNNPNAPEPKPKQEDPPPAGIILGVERIYQCRLRASAAAALGRIDHPQSRLALRRALAEDDDEYSDLYKGFAIMSLGQIGDTQALPALAELLGRTRDGRGRKRSAKLNSPLRGCAALALGLYGRPVPTPQGPRDRPQYHKACRMLADRVADRDETPEVRTAAALALGLTGRTENLKLLQPASRIIRGDEEILVGYMLLARGMLGDKNILTPARKFLAVASDRTDTSGMLARRAAVLGLGVLGNEQGIPILIDAWDLSYYVSREAALAFSLCEAYNVTDPLVGLLKDSDKVLAQSFAARCLGELFTMRRAKRAARRSGASVRPQRLSRLVVGSNYTMKNMRMVRFHSLANEFLFAYLIPCFGEDWR